MSVMIFAVSAEITQRRIDWRLASDVCLLQREANNTNDTNDTNKLTSSKFWDEWINWVDQDQDGFYLVWYQLQFQLKYNCYEDSE